MVRPTYAAPAAAPRQAPGAGEPGAGEPAPVVAGGVAIGSGTFTLIAHAGAAGGIEELVEVARLAREARAGLLDVGRAWEDLGPDAVARAQEAAGLPAVCSVREPADLAAVEPVAAALRVPAGALEAAAPGAPAAPGAAIPLLPRALGRAGLPVLLERDAATGAEAWLGAAERLAHEGNPLVVLCVPASDLAAVPSLRSAAGRPLLVDATGADDPAALARAAAAMHADGVMVGVTQELAALASELDAVAAAVGRRMAGRRIRYVGAGGRGGVAVPARGAQAKRWSAP